MKLPGEQILWATIPGLIIFLIYAVGTSALLYYGHDAKQYVFEPIHNVIQQLPTSGDKPDEPETILFTGDVMLGRYVETLMAKHGADYPFLYVEDLLQNSDLTFINLEGPIAIDHAQTPNGTTSFSFDEGVPNILASHGIDAVSLGNNHTTDRGQDDYDHTVNELATVGIASVGHSVTASSPVELAVGNNVVRIFSFNDTFPFNDSESYVAMVQSKSTSDMIDIVNIHWGAEYGLSSNMSQQELAHKLIDAGADLIVGHHPHVVQEIERYNGAMIFYSLGNFIFDQYFSVDVQQGLAIQLVIDGNDLSFDLVPIKSTKSQPQPMVDLERDEFLEGLADRSDASLRSEILNAYIQ